ncbi:ABC transporter permease [Peribacillus acanthi]|uniref:ABC transporter permease subunit n=1 Tax=Peribacillus acanthi TaxID=2171554 RepID=UPI000D3E6181|nr:ABC transporter permease [Peribacillus acanthi]
MRKIIHYPLITLTGMLGFVVFLAFPKLFAFPTTGDQEHLVLNSGFILSSFLKTLKALTTPSDWTFIEGWMKDVVIERYIYSLQIMGISLLFTILIGCMIACFIIFIPLKMRSPFKIALNFLEGLPDLFILFLLQMGLLKLYKDYGIKIFSLYGIAETKPYVFPMIINSILPSLFFAQYLLKVMEEEMEKHYILLGKAKGLSRVYIFQNYLLRNIFPVVMIHFKTIIFMVLTNLVLVEHMFVLDGYIHELYVILSFNSHNPLAIVFYVLMLMIPIFVFELLLILSAKSIGKIRGLQL